MRSNAVCDIVALYMVKYNFKYYIFHFVNDSVIMLNRYFLRMLTKKVSLWGPYALCGEGMLTI